MVQGLTAHYLVTDEDATAGLISPGERCLMLDLQCWKWHLFMGIPNGQVARLQGHWNKIKSKHEQAAMSGCDGLIVLDSPPGKSCAS
jgi:hypothetical protein